MYNNSLKILLDINPNKKYSIKEISIKIFEFLKASNIQNKLNTSARNKTIEKQELNHQVWNTVTNVFEKMVENLGDEKVTLREFYALLQLVFPQLQPVWFLLHRIAS